MTEFDAEVDLQARKRCAAVVSRINVENEVGMAQKNADIAAPPQPTGDLCDRIVLGLPSALDRHFFGAAEEDEPVSCSMERPKDSAHDRHLARVASKSDPNAVSLGVHAQTFPSRWIATILGLKNQMTPRAVSLLEAPIVF